MTHAEISAMNKRAKRRNWIVVLIALGAFLAGIFVMAQFNSRADSEKQRADGAAAAAQEACAQLTQLGYPCKFDPAKFRGPTGDQRGAWAAGRSGPGRARWSSGPGWPCRADLCRRLARRGVEPAVRFPRVPGVRQGRACVCCQSRPIDVLMRSSSVRATSSPSKDSPLRVAPLTDHSIRQTLSIHMPMPSLSHSLISWPPGVWPYQISAFSQSAIPAR